MPDLSRAAWRKSTHSCTSGCVEVAFVEGMVAVRDSKNRRGPVLRFTAREWSAFLDGIRGGEFELPPGYLEGSEKPADGVALRPLL
jgi:hypothetical protein